MNLDDLKQLRQQLDAAISVIEAGDTVDMSGPELAHYHALYGADSCAVGNFVIHHRRPFGASNAPDAR